MKDVNESWIRRLSPSPGLQHPGVPSLDLHDPRVSRAVQETGKRPVKQLETLPPAHEELGGSGRQDIFCFCATGAVEGPGGGQGDIENPEEP